MCIPDHVHPSLTIACRTRITNELVEQCERLGDRFAILATDSCQKFDDVRASRVSVETKGAGIDSPFAAIYYPWIVIPREERNQVKSFLAPAIGHVAGAWARNDADRGIHTAPVGLEIRGAAVQGIASSLSSERLDQIERLGINGLYLDSATGAVRIARARTTAIEYDRTHINVERTIAFARQVAQSLIRSLRLKRSDEEAWACITCSITVFLTELWVDGALRGSTKDEAFYVKCDADTNPPEIVDLAVINCEFGLALPEPGVVRRVLVVNRLETSGPY
jgi:phage tail sheath protein FI